MQIDDFRNYLNELDTLSQEVRQSPEFAMDSAKLDRDQLLRRFELNRALVNLLHAAAVHMMRADAPDYDPASEHWMLGTTRTAAAHVRQDLRDQDNAVIRDLSMRALDLVDRILIDLKPVSDARNAEEIGPLTQSA